LRGCTLLPDHQDHAFPCVVSTSSITVGNRRISSLENCWCNGDISPATGTGVSHYSVEGRVSPLPDLSLHVVSTLRQVLRSSATHIWRPYCLAIIARGEVQVYIGVLRGPRKSSLKWRIRR